MAGALGWMSAGCAPGGQQIDQCNDGIDNDGDGFIDGLDPACFVGAADESQDPVIEVPQCSDELDNDGDGLIDGDDPGCLFPDDNDESNDRIPACRDGVDNDSDGLIDFPNDPGCALGLEDDERDDCPGGARCPACGNLTDDDGDGLIDFPEDPGCGSASDTSEFNATANECGGNVFLNVLADEGEVTGVIEDGAGELISACGGGGGEIVYVLDLPERKAALLSTDYAETNLDTVVYVREGMCRDPAAELGCNDDQQGSLSSQLQVNLPEGRSYFVVDTHPGHSGSFRFSLELFIHQGDECDPANPDCPPGTVCRLRDQDAVVTTCELPECQDGLDNDGDGLSDFPREPGCDSPDDNDETDDCPAGPGCPQCGNQVDDDGDGLIDFPADLGCDAASDNNEVDECIPGTPLLLLTDAGASGTTPASGSVFTPSCNTSTTSAEDVYQYINARDLTSLTFSTVGSPEDTVLSVRTDDCGDVLAEVGCANVQNGGEDVTILNPAQEQFFVFVDGDFLNSVDYVLNVRGTIGLGLQCDPSDLQFVCDVGLECDGGSGTCVPSTCNNGVDDDGDGLIDFPADPGCEDISDTDEADDCPAGFSCPQCGNQADDDGDGQVDFPADPGCESAVDNTELDECIPGVGIRSLLDAGTTGTTPVSGDGSDFTPSCHTSTLSTEDEYHYFNKRNLTSLTFSTVGSVGDTVLSVRHPSCGDSADELACANDDGGEAITIANPVQNGDYFVFVDGDFVSNISYVLNVRGTFGFGQACDPADTQFTCELGLECDPVSLTCVNATCNNGIDDDGDGLTDFPNDPGCENASGTDETDDCPSGPNCPQCGNGVDDDGDARIDFPDDPGCAAASDDDETDECIPGVLAVTLPLGGVASTTPPSSAGSNFTPSCHTSTTSTEDVYSFLLDRQLSALTFSTDGSAGDTVLSVRRDDCDDPGTELACRNVQNGGEAVTISNPVQASYFVFVDGDFVSGINYVLNVSGTIPPGGACDPADAQFTCELGFACDPAALVCVGAVCNDRVDNDGDALIDYPDDPGCVDPSDDDEADDCPTGPECPQCGNDADDDGDGDIDFPADIGCLAAGDADELAECIAGVEYTLLTDAGLAGTTPPSSAGSKFIPSCHTSTTSTENVHVYFLERDLTSLSFSTVGSAGDTVLSARFFDCGDGSAELACNHVANAGEAIAIPNPAPGPYFVFVDGDFVSAINYVLNVSGTLGEGVACDPADTQFVCDAGFACDPSALECVPTACNDGADNDGDGQADFPADPGCDDIRDDDEADGCPTSLDCPQCANEVDDDGDALIDFGADLACDAASDVSELDECVPGASIRGLPDRGVVGKTPPSTAGSKFTPSCHTSTASTEDVYHFPLNRVLSSITFSTVGSAGDTVTSVQFGTCGDVANELGCLNVQNSGEAITVTSPAPGDYFVFVDGDFVSNIDYVLNVSGTIPPGEACDPDNTQFVCEFGQACDPASLVCVDAVCSDGLDNDGDALADYPDDPGCVHPSDNDEADDCPGGPTCPQCGNLVDDDGDADIDFPADIGCLAAGDGDEVAECIPGVAYTLLTDAGLAGTTPPSSAGSKFIPSCHTSTTSTENVHVYFHERDLETLTFSTVGSAGDTVLSARFFDCGDASAELACNHAAAAGEAITIASPTRGPYFVFVDGDFVSAISYVLNVSGTLGLGAACDPADAQFVCDTGLACDPSALACVAAACNDGVDNDGDGLADFPADPGCEGISDADEADGCPASLDCPQCANAIDDDGDTLIDFGSDLACEAASGVSELDECVPGAAIRGLPNVGVVGKTPLSSTGSKFTPSCHTSTASTEDVYHYPLTRPLSSLTFSTVGSLGDTVTSVQFGVCGDVANELGCLNVQNGGEAVTVTAPATGDYFVFVDGDFVSNIDYVLNVSGTIAAGEACDPADTQFVCDAGLTCDVGTGVCL